MTEIGSLVVTLSAETARLRDDLGEATRLVAAAGADIESRAGAVAQSLVVDDEAAAWARLPDRIGRAEAALASQSAAARQASRAARDLGVTFSSAFEDAAIRGERLRDVARGLVQDLARMVLRRTVTEPLAGAVTGALGSVFGGLFGGARAEGGPVDPSRAYLVGERGPELFMPTRPGTIVPNGVGASSVNVTMHLDLRHADRDAVLLLRAERDRIIQAARAAVAADIRQGGGLAKLTGARA